MGQLGLVRQTHGLATHGINGDIPEAGTGHGDFHRKSIEGTAVVVVPAAVLETAEIRIAHQADIAGLRAVDDDQIVFIEMLALVNELHVLLRLALSNRAPP